MGKLTWNFEGRNEWTSTKASYLYSHIEINELVTVGKECPIDLRSLAMPAWQVQKTWKPRKIQNELQKY